MQSNRSMERLAFAAAVGFAYLVAIPPAGAAVNRPPHPPTLDIPANGATNTLLQILLYWHASDPDGDDVRSDLYLGTESPPPLVEANILYTLMRSPPLQPGTTYRWKIVVRDEHGAETAGPEWTFSTKATNAPPTTPSGPNPPNGSTTALVTGSLRWQSDDPDGYDMYFDVYFGTESPPPFVGTIFEDYDTYIYYYYANLPFTTTFYWQIVARDPQGATATGPLWTFTTKANSAPYPPTNPHPAHNGITSTSPLLAWSGGDIDLQPLSYDLYLGQTSPPPLVATSLPGASFQTPTLVPGATYYWSVVASDGFFSTSGPIWSFGARQPGDVVADNVLTVEDAECALEIYLWNPECGGATGYLVADANCDANVTPADARCIHREVLGLGCAICDDAIVPSSPNDEEEIGPSVSLGSWFFEGSTLVVRLVLSGAPVFNAFGLYTSSSPSLPLLQSQRRGASNNFDVLEGRQVTSTYSYVAGYSLADQPLGTTAEFVELRFDASGVLPSYLLIDGFVDDLAGAGLLLLPLDTMVDVGTIPSRLALHQNYPNPFNPLTTISYDLPASAQPERVRLRIVDVTGRVVRTLVDQDQAGGSYRVTWEGKDNRGENASSGIYFSVLDARGTRQTRKLVLLK